MSNVAPEDEHVAFAVYAVATGDVMMLGGCARKDMDMQATFFPDTAVMEIEQRLRQAPGAYRVELADGTPRLVEL